MICSESFRSKYPSGSSERMSLDGQNGSISNDQRIAPWTSLYPYCWMSRSKVETQSSRMAEVSNLRGLP